MSDPMRRALTRAGTLHEYQALVVQIARLRSKLPWTDDDYDALLIACQKRNALECEAVQMMEAA